MSRTSTIRFRWLGGVAAFALIAAGGVALSPVASGTPGLDTAKKIQPRSSSYVYGNWAQPGAGFMTGAGDTSSQVYQLTSRSQFPDLDDTPGPIYAAGTFIQSGVTTINRVGQFAAGGSQWTPLTNDTQGIGPGVGQSTAVSIVPGVYGLALGGDDSLYAGGSFVASDDTLNNVGQWNGSDWVRLGLGLKSNTNGRYVQDMVVGNDFIGGDDTNYADDTAYALGGFEGPCATLACSSATTTMTGIAQYSQADDTWYAMGDGTLSGASFTQIFAGAYIDDTLYVGGNFDLISGVSANYIAQWDESTDTWLPLGGGVGPAGKEVTAMAVNPITKDLYVGGNFSTAGSLTSVPGIVKWDYLDDTWFTVGTGLTGGVVDDISFSPDGNTMYLGMFGGSVDGYTASYVARLTSTQMSSDAATNVTAAWQYLKSSGNSVGTNGAARAALAQADGSVMFGGNFSVAGATTAGRVATFTPGPEPSPYDPVYPPGPPTDVVATGGFRTISVDWKAPTYTGSYPITNYLVTATPGNRVCISSLSDVKLTQCTFRDLTPGTRYTFTVQGLNGGGWGERSAASNVATPTNLRVVAADRKITKFLGIVTGSEVRAAGIAPGFAPGTKIVPWTKIGSGEWVAVANSGLTVNAEEKFTWKRKFGRNQNSQPIAIRFEIGGNFTNTVNFRPVK